MNMQIKTLYYLTFLFFLVIAGASSFVFFELHKHTMELKELQHNHFKATLVADELRQSSDDLTRFARTYVSTGDEQYKKNYFTTLAFRNGQENKPLYYNWVYWDLSEPLRSSRHPKNKTQSTIEQINKLPLLETEKEKLKKVLSNSNSLTEVEKQAFNAMQGLFKDENGKYNIQATPKPELARSLLFSPAYHQAKEKVMLPLDEFYELIHTRLHQKILNTNIAIEKHFKQKFILLLIAIMGLVVMFSLSFYKIILPIKKLSQAILTFQKGGKDIGEITTYDDEFGLMTEQFFAMKKKMDDDYECIRQLSLTDPLTKISNRRSFFEISEQLFKISHRTEDPFCILIIDLDFFKDINDTYGHIAGDEVLQHIVNVVKKQLRVSDIFARFGGEEFILLFPKTSLSGSLIIAEKIRQQVENTPHICSKEACKVESRIDVTVSIGVAEWAGEEKVRSLIKRVDNALYKAKENGRNRVESDQVDGARNKNLPHSS